MNIKKLKTFLLLCAASTLMSCTLSEDGLDLESTLDVDACKKSGSTNCIVEEGKSQLSMTIRSDNPIRPFSIEGDCFGAEAPNGLDPIPYNPTAPNPSANIYPQPANNTVIEPLYCFDISGDCNEGNNETASVILKSAPSYFNGINPNVIAECKRGRFKAQLAARFPIDRSQICKRYTLELELVGKSINDEEERNPSQARSFVDVLVTSHSLCTD